MKVQRSQHGRSVILAVDGPLLEEAVRTLEEHTTESIEQGLTVIVLDFTRVPFIDSAGLETISGLVTRLGRLGGDLRVCCLNEVCKDIFDATRMIGFVQIFDTRDDALSMRK